MHVRGRSAARRAPIGATGVLTLALALALALTLALALALTPAGDTAPAVAAATPRAADAAPTTFRVATFNVLGHSHTKPGGDRKGWAQSPDRMDWTVQLVKQTAVDLIGFQEFEPVQYRMFARRAGAAWDLAPDNDRAPLSANSIAWRTSEWTAVVRSTYRAPYFHGRMQDRPLVQLRHNRTGQLVWVLNTHNPADTHGDAKQWRDQSERIQAALVNRLRQRSPGVPVVFVGDMNDRRDFYCPVTYLTELESASGGTHGDPPDGSCTLAPKAIIDWIMGTPDIAFSGYTSFRDALVKKTSDHPFVYSDATVRAPASSRAGVRRVVVIDVQGLRPSAVIPARARWISWLRAHGASTLRARTTVESSAAVPNTVSMVTGRRVSAARGGHGATTTKAAKPSSTVRRTAGQYVSSIFDMAHNLGLPTGLYSGDVRARFLQRSWNGVHGGPDTWGRDNGRRKFSTVNVSRSDAAASKAARARLASKALPLTFVQLSQPARTGQRSGFTSAAYYRDLRTADVRVGKILSTIARDRDTAGSTLVVLTASTSGLTRGNRFAVPLIVWGPGVDHGDLYRMNPQFRDPGGRRTTYSGPQPIRTGDVANLVSGALRLPTIPRSQFDTRRTLNVFGPSVTTRLSASRNSSGR